MAAGWTEREVKVALARVDQAFPPISLFQRALTEARNGVGTANQNGTTAVIRRARCGDCGGLHAPGAPHNETNDGLTEEERARKVRERAEEARRAMRSA